MDLNKYENGIKKTGFGLEYKIASQLKQAGWSVINNKYYIDDREDDVREIDLVAYKSASIKPFQVYTTLVISCKKSEQNIWTLLAKEIDLKNPNVDWQPFHGWTNDKVLDYQLSLSGFSAKYYEDVRRYGVGQALRQPDVEIFAFQELNRETGLPQNDKPIFSSITSLMKAQAYELNALPKRKKEAVVYQFNLLSIVETDLVQLYFSDSEIRASEVDTAQYVARYIINKKEMFSRILFVKSKTFQDVIRDFDCLHKANCELFPSLRKDFYSNIFIDSNRINVLLDDFRKAVSWKLKWSVNDLLVPADIPDFNSITLSIQEDNGSLVISIPSSAAALPFLNSDAAVTKHVSIALKSIYHYDGAFRFSDECPF